MPKPSLKIDPSETFWVTSLKKSSVLNNVIHLYAHICNNLEKLQRNTNLELTVGSVRYVYQVDENNKIQLINN